MGDSSGPNPASSSARTSSSRPPANICSARCRMRDTVTSRGRARPIRRTGAGCGVSRCHAPAPARRALQRPNDTPWVAQVDVRRSCGVDAGKLVRQRGEPFALEPAREICSSLQVVVVRREPVAIHEGRDVQPGAAHEQRQAAALPHLGNHAARLGQPVMAA